MLCPVFLCEGYVVCTKRKRVYRVYVRSVSLCSCIQSKEVKRGCVHCLALLQTHSLVPGPSAVSAHQHLTSELGGASEAAEGLVHFLCYQTTRVDTVMT